MLLNIKESLESSHISTKKMEEILKNNFHKMMSNETSGKYLIYYN